MSAEFSNSAQKIEEQVLSENLALEKRLKVLIVLSYLLFPFSIVTLPIFFYHRHKANNQQKNKN